MRVPYNNSHYQSDEDEDDDDRSCDFNFHPYQSLGPSLYSTLKEKSQTLNDGALICKIERNMKELSENLLHGIEGINTRLIQLENRTQNIDNVVDDLKYYTGYNHGRTDGKLKNLENILLEVKDDVHFLREKQEIAETKIQLAKLRASSKTNSQSNVQKSASQTNPVQQAPPYAPLQPHPPLLVESIGTDQLRASLLPHSQIPAQQNHYWHTPPHQSYPEQQTTPYFPSYSYPPSQFSTSPKPDEYNPGSAYASSSIKPSYYSQFASVTGGESKYPKLPEAQILPHALPVQSEGSGDNRVIPMDDVVEMVTSMGFRRDLVKATAWKLLENGQPVDLNLVLDKMMNTGAA